MIKYTKEYPFGPLTLVEDEGALTNILFTDGSEFECDAVLTPLLEKGFRQLEEYFAHKRFLFTVDFRLPQGEEEEMQVLEILRRLPYGETYPLECVTEGVGLPLNPDTKAEVIDIMELNPLPILVPCHRIVDPDFHPAYGDKIKEMMLALEKEPLQH